MALNDFRLGLKIVRYLTCIRNDFRLGLKIVEMFYNFDVFLIRSIFPFSLKETQRKLQTEFISKIKTYLSKNNNSFVTDKKKVISSEVDGGKSLRESTGFKCSLLSLCWFTLRSSSDLDIGLKVNVRVAREENLTTTVRDRKSILEAIHEDNNNSFQSKGIEFVFFKIKEPEKEGEKLCSMFEPGIYKRKKGEMKQASISVQDYSVDYVKHDDVAALAFVLNCDGVMKPEDDTSTICDMETILTKLSQYPCNSEEAFKTFIKDGCNMPFFEYQEEEDLTYNLRRFRTFFRLLTPVFVNMVEGNHRLQVASNYLFGFDMTRPYPQKCEANMKEIPQGSTLRKNIDSRLYFPNSKIPTNESVKMLFSMSKNNQINAGIYIPCTIKDVLEEILKRIEDSDEFQEFHDDITDFAKASCTDEDAPDKFLKAHEFINNVIGDYVTQRSGDWLTASWITSNIVFNKDQAQKWIEYTHQEKGGTEWFGYMSHSSAYPSKVKMEKLMLLDTRGFKDLFHSWSSNGQVAARKLLKKLGVKSVKGEQGAWIEFFVIYSLFLGICFTKEGVNILRAFLRNKGNPSKKMEISIFHLSFLAQHVITPINTAQHMISSHVPKNIKRKQDSSQAKVKKVLWLYRHELFATYLKTLTNYPDLTVQISEKQTNIQDIISAVNNERVHNSLVIYPTTPLLVILSTYPGIIYNWSTEYEAKDRDNRPLDKEKEFGATEIKLRDEITNVDKYKHLHDKGQMPEEWKFPDTWKLDKHIDDIMQGKTIYDLELGFLLNKKKKGKDKSQNKTPDNKKRPNKGKDSESKKPRTCLSPDEKQEAKEMEQSFFETTEKIGKEHQKEVLLNMKKLLETVLFNPSPKLILDHVVKSISNEMEDKGLSPAKQKDPEFILDDDEATGDKEPGASSSEDDK